MPRGGRRPGAGNPNWKIDSERAQSDGKKGGCPKGGRPKGSGNNKRSYAIIKEAYDTGIMPLELLLREMRREYAKGTEESLKEARLLAQAACPYTHPRLQAIMAQTTLETGDTLTALMKAIDGTTTGITRGSALEAEQPLPLPN
jgi:hypothetical protein